MVPLSTRPSRRPRRRRRRRSRRRSRRRRRRPSVAWHVTVLCFEGLRGILRIHYASKSFDSFLLINASVSVLSAPISRSFHRKFLSETT